MRNSIDLYGKTGTKGRDGLGVQQGSNLVLLLFNLLLERQSSGLFDGEFSSERHQSVVGVHYVGSDFV